MVEDNSRGNAVLEFALILWIILLLAFAGLEFGRAYNRWQIATTLSREAARQIYAKCGHGAYEGFTSDCLNQVRADIQILADGLVAKSGIVLAEYTWDSSNGVRKTGGSATHLFDSRCKVDQGDCHGLDPQLLIDQRRIVVSEVFVPLQPLFLNFVETFNISGGMLYDITVI